MRGAETGITATAILSIAVNLSKKLKMRTNQYNMIYYDTTDKKSVSLTKPLTLPINCTLNVDWKVKI
ncbi:MAG TPA: hypothetical protein DCM38_10865 [Gammaproteobacteria bacterium]|nr:hypothetical protein [Gammaproteobacteria bacterium]